jgi:hypothetical protein
MTRSSSHIIGQLRAAEQYTTDLPVLGGVPTKIDCSNEMLGSVFMDAKGDFYWVVAENATQAAVLLANAATRFSSKAGAYEFSVLTLGGDIYVMSTGAVEVNGLSYTFGYIVA